LGLLGKVAGSRLITIEAMKIKRKYNCIFEKNDAQDLIFVHFEDLDGFLHYEHADDPTKQIYTMTSEQLLNEGYKRI